MMSWLEFVLLMEQHENIARKGTNQDESAQYEAS